MNLYCIDCGFKKFATIDEEEIKNPNDNNLIDVIRQILYLLYQDNKTTKKLYKNLIEPL